MSNPSLTVGADEAPPAAAAVKLVGMTLAHASVLARSGRLEEAAALLEDVLSMSPPDVGSLDLLAKVRAQQGRWDAAEQLWVRAGELAGGSSFEAALNRLRAARRRPRWVRPVPVAAALCAMLLIAAAGVRWAGGGPVRQQPAVAAAPAPVKQPPQPSRDGQPAPGAAAPLDLEVSGARTVRRGSGFELTFAEAMFSEGTTLTAGGSRTLEELGAQLRRLPANAYVIVTGFTDDVPVGAGRGFRDNAALGVARAAVAADRLRAAAGATAREFLLGMGNEAERPYPNDSPENRRRNRTVTLRIRL